MTLTAGSTPSPVLDRPTRPSLAPLADPVHADRPAVVSASGRAMSHAELGAAVAGLAARLPDAAEGRRLVHLPLGRDLLGVLSYLATLEAGHVALVTAGEDRASAVLERYAPDVTATGDPVRPFEVLQAAPRHLLHPDLALLLSTSGSTGSPKLVRLSHANLHHNAAAIAQALALTAEDRAITSLPLHYTFGLSVLHSHLVAGASVVLHEGSVLDEDFWSAVDGLGVTTLAVVPHLVELMETTGALDRPHPSLRLVAQAGGRMGPERVLRTATLGERHGWGLSVMYGQTEATARICVLDPALVAAHPDSVGRPVADTTLHLDTTVPEAAEGAGEVVVRGPGVMMGYAEHPDDLALGAMLDELRTGDLGGIGPDGLLRLVGRRSGFTKVMGVRIDVGTVEDRLDTAGYRACVGGDGSRLTVAVEPVAGRADREVSTEVRRLAGTASGLGPAAVAVAVAPLPRLPNGKVDRPASAALVRSVAEQATAPDAGPRTAAPAAPGPRGTAPEQDRAPAAGEHAGEAADATAPLDARTRLAAGVAAAVSSVLVLDAADLDRTFVQHGGDSLSHVQASARLERLLGPLPRDWHHRPLSDLVELGLERGRAAGPDRGAPAGRAAVGGAAPTAPGRGDRPGRQGTRRAPGRPWRDRARAALAWRGVETSVVLRAVAVVAICGSHADLIDLMGGAHVLMAVAGFNTARFGLSVPTVAGRWRSTARIAIGVAVPAMLIAAVGMLTTGRYGWSNIMLSHWITGDTTEGSTANEYWFIDALLASVLVLVAVLSVPAVSRAWRRDPWRVAAWFTAAALVPRFLVLSLTDSHMAQSIMPTTLWLVGVGAAAAWADSTRRRWITAGLAVVGGAWFFPDQPGRELAILVGLLVLVWVPRLRVPALALPLVGVLAAASLYVYLVQFMVLSSFEDDVVETVAALATGCLVWWLADRPMRRLQGLVPAPQP
ncbi:AMP-dependent synthetase [Citricoccus sp. SGAir0253]|uniref:AMP-binding protein n=1 Tax=Citricoccus sp. SGAir0253 TaxID=2567881 RepID=UPI0010CD4E0D|nr:AMP-binding protein [Citricoccus sp. SGAir0253]QCU78245.1 AMP-dependent synthetase [Citricoccus sp. SGAir0253]